MIDKIINKYVHITFFTPQKILNNFFEIFIYGVMSHKMDSYHLKMQICVS
jgi:hypothetical protein